MKRGNTFRLSWSGRCAVLIGMAMIGVSFGATQARAGCFDSSKAGAAPTAFLGAHAILPAPDQDDQGSGQSATIVGVWHVIYTATYSTSGPIPVPVIPPGPPDSFTFAETMKTWHADGTEWEEKIEPPPAGFCFGVWKHTATGSEKLHHFGAVTAPDGSVVAVFYEDELNRVAPGGKSYSGTFDFKLYGPTDVLGTGPVLQEIKGTTAATRITVD